MNYLKETFKKIGFMTISALLLPVASKHCHAQGGYVNVRNVYDAASYRQSDTGLDPEKSADEEGRAMLKKLKLSDDQMARVERILTTYAIKRVELYHEMKKLTPPVSDDLRAKLHEKIVAVKAGKDRELRAVLTEEQFQLYLKK